jgi:hypothetical protein
MVKINCAALPKDLIESELFGHVKGAFTGASTDKSGLLEEAHRGSLLLDEITEMPLDLQAKLLRVLEDRTVRRLGGAKSVPVDFRLICSTNREPDAALREGRLRQDLYFRINTVTVALPSLRDRSGDIAAAKAFRASARSTCAPSRASILRPIGAPRLSVARQRGNSSTPSSGRCWWPAARRSCWPTCPTAARRGGQRDRVPATPALEEIERVSIVAR